MINGTSPRSWNQGIMDVSSDKKEMLGTRRVTPDGRVFRYALNGTGALAAGKIGQSPAYVSAHAECSVAAAAIGDRVVTVTLGATAATLKSVPGRVSVDK